MVEMFLPTQIAGDDIAGRVANFLHINPTGNIIQHLRWLGLFSNEKTDVTGDTAAAAMIELLNRKLTLTAEGRDMVILLHRFAVRYPEEGDRRERVTTTMIDRGEPGGFTAMARTVGMPVGIAAKLLLEGELPLTGCPIPTHPVVYTAVLRELEQAGLRFTEKVEADVLGPPA